MRLPPGTPSHTHMDWDGFAARTECEGYPLIGAHPRRHAPPGCRIGNTAVMYAAVNDHHAIVARLVAARADLNTKNIGGCALPPSARPAAFVGRRLCRLRRAPSGRQTALHWAARNGCTKSAVALLVGGADQTITNNEG